MKRFIAVLSGLLVLPAFAEVAPVFYEEFTEEMTDAEMMPDAEIVIEEDAINVEETKKTPIVPQRISPRNTSGRAASRAVSADTSVVAPGRNTQSASRAVTARTATTAPVTSAVRSATTRGAASRAARTTNTQQTVSARTTPTTSSSVARAGVTNSTSIIQPDTVQTPLYTGRVSTRSSTSKIRARIPTISVSNTVSATPESAADLTSSMDELAQITDFCKAQYTECMDNFCNVLDDNQGRCSCSKNLESYAKTEAALDAATAELQEIAQKIQYIGLTGEQIETLFTQTEAEATMQSSSDNTQLKNDLDNIRDMIVDVKSGSTSTSSSGLSIDLSGLLDFTIDSTGFDLSSLLGGNTNTNSISNQRGEQLYKTAVARCKATVLNNCQAQGVDTSLITNSYDLEIDKQCLAYERSLTDANDQMASTVRNAKAVLQKARLLVAQQKNTYDLRGCISELDKCMQDEFVCGSDYENCLDPTGKYIVNGEVVVGSTPGHTIVKNMGTDGPALYPTDGLYATWNYDNNNHNAWASKIIDSNDNVITNDGNLADYIIEYIGSDTAATSSATDMLKMADYLESKIGSHDDNTGRDSGMCMSVLNQCQDYTYSEVGKNKTYIKNNEVIREYMYRTLTKIKTMQDEIIADFAENCIADVSSCLSQNNYPDSPTGGNGSAQENIAVNACRAIIASCMSVNGNATKDPQIKEMLDWTCDTISGKNCGGN